MFHPQVKRFPDPVKKMATENEYLRQEVLSKTQQVKQYKKQVDQYKEKVEVLKRQIEMQIQQVIVDCLCYMTLSETRNSL